MPPTSLAGHISGRQQDWIVDTLRSYYLLSCAATAGSVPADIHTCLYILYALSHMHGIGLCDCN